MGKVSKIKPRQRTRAPKFSRARDTISISPDREKKQEAETSARRYLRNRVLSVVGVLGLAVTLVGSLEPLIQIADIVRFALDRWYELTRFFWNSLLGLFGLRVDATTVVLLNAGAFCLAMQLGSFGPPIPTTVGTLLLRVVNGVTVACLFFVVLFASFLRAEAELTPIPDPFSIDSWADSTNWLTLGAYVFAFSGITIGFDANPYRLLRRLLDVGLVFSMILALNYVSIYAPVARSLIGSIVGEI